MTSKIDNIKIPAIPRSFNEEEANRIIQSYISEIKRIENSPRGLDIVDFFPLVQKAIRTREEQDGVPIDKRLLVLEDDPPEAIDTEAITWSIISRIPGQYDQGPAGKGKIREVVPHMRSMINHPDHPSEKLIAMGKLYSNWIQFNIYARNSKTAMNRVLWLEKVMDSFRWYFKLNSFEVIEDSVLGKEKVTIDNLVLVKYPVVYYVRSEDIYHITTQDLKRILVKTDVSNY
jgi:hypothetical protein